MKELTLDSWEDFEAELDKMRTQRNHAKGANGLYISGFLFRGLGNSDWSLSTTLERFSDKEFSLYSYYKLIFAAKTQIETFTDQEWDIPTPPEFQKWLDTEDGDLFLINHFPAYEYQIYLRHHGFPSPLLDWTKSPYVAAFFAFCEIKSEQNVSIYAYQEYSEGGKSYSSNKPYISTFGPYIKSHKRHFLQQSQYTVCSITKDKNKSFYTSHDNFAKLDEEKHDLLWKFNLPVSERLKVLKKLDQYNLNSFSLFGNEESLMQTIAQREHYFRE